MTTVALLSIVKDEEENIERMLESVYHHIDTYCIVDTGSTDNTKQIIRKFFDKHDIKGTLIDAPWVDFSDARNRYLKYGYGIADWGLVVDADRTLVVTDSNWKDKLPRIGKGDHQVPMMRVMIEHGDESYYNNMLIRLKGKDLPKVKYRLPTHECLVPVDESLDAYLSFAFDGIKLIEHATGSSRTVKHKRDSKLLKRFLFDNSASDPLYSRALYYYGQTCEEMGRHKDAFYGYWSSMGLTNSPAEASWAAYKIAYLPSISVKDKLEALEQVFKYGYPEAVYANLHLLLASDRVGDAEKLARKYISEPCYTAPAVFTVSWIRETGLKLILKKLLPESLVDTFFDNEYKT